MPVDMISSIQPKTDRLNADSLFPDLKPVIQITDVQEGGEDGTDRIFSYKGDNGKPWHPCKTMRRVIIGVWGEDPAVYIGRYIKLFRDPKVKFGPDTVGGIRISHMSHITAPMQLSLTVSQGRRKPYVVLPLPADEIPSETAEPAPADPIDVRALQDKAMVVAEGGTLALQSWWKSIGAAAQKALKNELPQFKDAAAHADKNAEREASNLDAGATESTEGGEGGGLDKPLV